MEKVLLTSQHRSPSARYPGGPLCRFFLSMEQRTSGNQHSKFKPQPSPNLQSKISWKPHLLEEKRRPEHQIAPPKRFENFFTDKIRATVVVRAKGFASRAHWASFWKGCCIHQQTTSWRSSKPLKHFCSMVAVVCALFPYIGFWVHLG